MRRLRHLLLVLATGVSLAFGASASEPLQLRYDIYSKGFRLFEFAMALDVNAQSYRVDGNFHTRGFWDKLMHFALESSVEGAVHGSELRPGLYRSASRFLGHGRQTAIEHQNDGRVVVSVNPAADEEKVRTPIPPGELDRTIDAMTAAAQVAKDLGSGRSCTHQLRVFDGVRRYDLILADEGFVELKPASNSSYSGPARRCRIVQHRIGGFAAKAKPAAEAVMFVAPILPDSPPLPVRIELDSEWGFLQVVLAEAAQKQGIYRLNRLHLRHLPAAAATQPEIFSRPRNASAKQFDILNVELRERLEPLVCSQVRTLPICSAAQAGRAGRPHEVLSTWTTSAAAAAISKDTASKT
jgi:hypothetical protein